MKNIKGDLFAQKADAICITTNGFTKSNGECVMGKGCAQKATQKWPTIAMKLGTLLKQHGNRAMILGKTEDWSVVSFPVKGIKETFDGSNAVRHMASKFERGDSVPGWACKARLEIIVKSAKELVEMADKFGWTNVVIPRPGCGAGELEWNEVEPLLQSILDDRFSAITF